MQYILCNYLRYSTMVVGQSVTYMDTVLQVAYFGLTEAAHCLDVSFVCILQCMLCL